jgi:hypothetical protein
MEDPILSLNPFWDLWRGEGSSKASAKREYGRGWVSLAWAHQPEPPAELAEKLTQAGQVLASFGLRADTRAYRVRVSAFAEDTFLGEVEAWVGFAYSNFATGKYIEPWHYAKAYEALAKLKALHPQLTTGVTGSAKGTKHGQVWVYILVAHTTPEYAALLQRLGGEEENIIGDLESQIAELTSAIDKKYAEIKELEAKLESLRLKLELEKAKRAVV